MTFHLSGAKILVLAPHTDDGELGAGGSIARWVEDRNDVHYVAFSACETIQPPDTDPGILRVECADATAELGIRSDRLRILDFEVRHFARDRQRVLDVMVRLNQEIRPDIVLVPSVEDTHQDHFVVATEAMRAFKRTGLFGYEAPWNNYQFEVTAFVALQEHHVEKKWMALKNFRSQYGRPYMTQDYIQAQTHFRGVQAGTRYAEAFQVMRAYL